MNADKNPIYIEGDPEHSDLSKRHMFYLFMKKTPDGNRRYELCMKPILIWVMAFYTFLPAGMIIFAQWLLKELKRQNDSLGVKMVYGFIVLFIMFFLYMLVQLIITTAGTFSIELKNNAVFYIRKIGNIPPLKIEIPISSIDRMKVEERYAKGIYHILLIEGDGKKIEFWQAPIFGTFQREYLDYLEEKIREYAIEKGQIISLKS